MSNMTVDRGSVLLTHCDEIIVCVSLHTDKICLTFMCTYHCRRMLETQQHLKPEILSSSKRVPSLDHQCSTHRATLLLTSAFFLLGTLSAFTHPSPTATAETLHGTAITTPCHLRVNSLTSNKVNPWLQTFPNMGKAQICLLQLEFPPRSANGPTVTSCPYPTNHLQEGKLNASRPGKPK